MDKPPLGLSSESEYNIPSYSLIVNLSMKTKYKTSPKDFFLHLLMIITLYGSAISIITILFQIINITIPDLLDYQYGPYDSSVSIIRSAVATLIVMFPVYLGTMKHLGKEYKANPEKRSLPIRKWLIYLTIFIGSIVYMVDLISIIRSFLEGEVTLRFILKALSILMVVGSILFYYIRDLKQHNVS